VVTDLHIILISDRDCSHQASTMTHPLVCLNLGLHSVFTGTMDGLQWLADALLMC
jgi:hypothetical protein